MKMKGIIAAAALAVAVCGAADAATERKSECASAPTSLRSGALGASKVMDAAPLVARFKTWGAALGSLISDKWSRLTIIIR